MILFQQYTDVVAWQLFGGWILAVLGIPIVFLLYWNARAELKHFLWVKSSQWSAEDYGRMIKGQNEKLSAANDKVKSLEARISRLTDRPRGKNGRFEKNKGK